MVLILDGISEYVAHAKRKKYFWLLSIQSNVLKRSNNRAGTPISMLPPYISTMVNSDNFLLANSRVQHANHHGSYILW